MAVDFSISMVVYNTPMETLTKALDSVKSQSVASHFVLVDHSENQKFKELLRLYPDFLYLPRQNDGYGAGNNAGQSIIPGSEFVLVLNPDIVLGTHCLTSIKQLFNEDKSNSLGLVSGKINYPDGKWQNLQKRFPTFLGLVGRRFSKLQKMEMIRSAVGLYERQDADPNLETDVEFLPGCLLALRRSAWDAVSGFDTGFFLYFEDFDLCEKVRLAGFRVLYSPRFQAIHEYQRSTHSSLLHFYLFTKSMLRFFRKWGFRWK